jgi:hypothetical protein
MPCARSRTSRVIRVAPQIFAVEFDQIESAKDRHLARPLPADKAEHRKALLIGDDRLAVDQTGACRQSGDRRGGLREAAREVIAIPGEQPYPIAVAAAP